MSYLLLPFIITFLYELAKKVFEDVKEFAGCYKAI
jgi:hypothetical protein